MLLGGPGRKKERLRYRRRNKKRMWTGVGCRTQESSYPEDGGSRVVARMKGFCIS